MQRKRRLKWEKGGGGIVVDAVLTSVISAEIETRCWDDEKWEEEESEGAVQKRDEGEEGNNNT